MTDAAHNAEKPWSLGLILGLAAASAVSQLVPRRSAAAPAGSPSSQPQRENAVTAPSSSELQKPTGDTIITKRTLVQIAKNVFARIGKNNLPLVSAGIAFYAMTAIFPAIAAFVSVYGLFADPATIQQQIVGFSSLLPPESLKIITDALQSFAAKNHSSLNVALIVSVTLAIWSAKAGVSSLMTGLNIANETPEKRNFVVQQIVALGLTAGSVLFALVAIAAVAVLPAVLDELPISDTLKWSMGLGRWPILGLLVALGLAVFYYVGPSVEHRHWKWVSWGASIATLLWIIGSVLFSLYVSHFSSYDKTYGSLAAPVILLLWFWLSALIVLIGEEIDAELQAVDSDKGTRTREQPAHAP